MKLFGNIKNKKDDNKKGRSIVKPPARLAKAVISFASPAKRRKRQQVEAACQTLREMFEGRELWTPPNSDGFEERLVHLANDVPAAFSTKIKLSGYYFTVLYLACVYNCSLETIKVIHKAYPYGVKDTNGPKDTFAIHAAARYGCTCDILKYLAKHHPGSLRVINRWGDSPLKMATYGLYRLYFETSDWGVVHTDTAATMREKIEYLLRVDPEGAAEQTQPLHFLCEAQPSFVPTYLMEMVILGSPLAITSSAEEDFVDNHGNEIALSKTPADKVLQRPDTPDSTVRAILESCPYTLCYVDWDKLNWNVRSIFAEHNLTQIDDGRGLGPEYNKQFPLHSMVRCLESAFFVEQCIRRFPTEWNRKDHTGSFVLHVGLRTWLSYQAVGLVVDVEPQACLTTDPITGTHPLVAIAGRLTPAERYPEESAELSRSNIGEWSEANHLDAIYRVLRVDPHEILSSVQNSNLIY